MKNLEEIQKEVKLQDKILVAERSCFSLGYITKIVKGIRKNDAVLTLLEKAIAVRKEAENKIQL